MGVKSLDARIQFQRLAPLGSRSIHQPVEQHLAVATRPILLVGHQVVYVEDSTRIQVLDKPESRNGPHSPLVFKEREAIPTLLLQAHACDKPVGRDVRSQLAHHRVATCHLIVRLGHLNSHGSELAMGERRRGRNSSSRLRPRRVLYTGGRSRAVLLEHGITLFEALYQSFSRKVAIGPTHGALIPRATRPAAR